MRLPNDQDASGRTFGSEELDAVRQALESGTLTSTKGTFVKQLEADFAGRLGVKHAFACTSGTAALHCAVAAINPEPGEEMVTTPITDMGALSSIVQQGAVPVFADVDPHTYNVTAETIEARLSDRTRAIFVTHLFGQPCAMDDIMDLANARGIPVIEDCAQSFGATWKGRATGTIGALGCFSLQQGKHITTGEGGLVTTNDDDLARRVFLFINKAWGYGDQNPDHYFLAPNYRMNEITGAVALAQLAKLDDSVRVRCDNAAALTEKLQGTPGVETPRVVDGAEHTYWKYCLRVDGDVIPNGPVGLAGKLKEYSIASGPRYVQKPAYKCQIFREQNTFGNSRWPFSLARPEAVDYDDAKYAGSLDALAHVLVLPWNEKYTTEHVDYLAGQIRTAAEELAGAGV